MLVIEKALLRDMVKGSEPAFQQLFELYRDRLFAYVFKLVKSKQLAEEITMDVFRFFGFLNRRKAAQILSKKTDLLTSIIGK